MLKASSAPGMRSLDIPGDAASPLLSLENGFEITSTFCGNLVGGSFLPRNGPMEKFPGAKLLIPYRRWNGQESSGDKWNFPKVHAMFQKFHVADDIRR